MSSSFFSSGSMPHILHSAVTYTSDQINSSMLNFSYSEGMTKGRIWGKLNGLSLLTSTINQRGCTWSTVTKEWKFFTDPFLHKKIHIYTTGEHARLSNFRG